ncbi:hypothetical protein ACP70R_030446 [Stipagrostis hirtigluma subsp. patula]
MAAALPLASNNNGGAAMDLEAQVPVELLSAGTAMEPGASMKLARLLLWLGFLTLLMDVGTVLYKPPRGVIFERHHTGYYLTLSGVFAAGIVEVWAAIWLSSPGEDNGRRLAYARALLYMSVVPLVVVVALGGFAVLLKG